MLCHVIDARSTIGATESEIGSSDADADAVPY